MLSALGLLLVAIAAEVGATSALPRTNGFRDLGWTVAVLLGYAVSIWLLAAVVKHLSVSTAYAVWSGLGTAAVAVIGAAYLGEPLTPLRIVAIAMIVVGVVVLNLQGLH